MAVYLSLALSPVLALAGPLVVDNVPDGSVLRHPLVFLRGAGCEVDATTVETINTRVGSEVPGLAHRGSFRALARLGIGENTVEIRCGADSTSLRLRYLPQTNPKVTRLFWMTDASGDDRILWPGPAEDNDWKGRLATAGELYQAYTADWMHTHGYGFRTFNLERDAKGRPVVHLIRGATAGPALDAPDFDLLHEMDVAVRAQQPGVETHDLVLPQFTPADFWNPTSPRRGRLAVTCGLISGSQSCVFYGWPRHEAEVFQRLTNPEILDGTRLPSHPEGLSLGEAVAGAVGVPLHELAHNWGLPHTALESDLICGGRLLGFFGFERPARRGESGPQPDDPRLSSCMSRASATLLSLSPGFALDTPGVAGVPQLTKPAPSSATWPHQEAFLARADPTSGELVIAARNGVSLVGLLDDAALRAIATGAPGSSERTVRIAAESTLAFGDLSKLRLVLVSALNERVEIPLTELLTSGYVRAWHVSPLVQPWTRYDRHVELEEGSLEQITRAALSQPLRHALERRVNLASLRPPGAPDQSTAVYLARRLHTDVDRTVRLITGSDDSIRIFLDGRLVQSVIQARGYQTDSDSATVKLSAGDHVLLVEVGQVHGPWELTLRIEDTQDGVLELTNSGRLIPHRTVTWLERMKRSAFMEAWKVHPAGRPWTVHHSLPELTRAEVEQLASETLAGVPLNGDLDPSIIDLTQLSTASTPDNICKMLACEFKTDRTRTVQFVTASDDALRIWVDGGLVIRSTHVRGFRRGEDSRVVPIPAGDHRILVEVFNAGGPHAFALSLHDEDGHTLRIDDSGELVPSDSPTGPRRPSPGARRWPWRGVDRW